MTNARWIGILLLCTLQVASLYGHAQLTQQIRGTVTDQLLQTPLPGATVSLTGTNLKTITNEEGKFLFAQVPVGTYQIEVSYVGYRNAHLNNLVLITGKQLVVQVGMELAVAAENTVFVKGRSNRNRPVNDRSLVSTRAFTVEETQKYAAAVNDPLRMATNYAGVVGADDGNNHIIIRGNAPTGLLWRMEGIDVPNPNHFAAANSSGGGISILSAALLSNSDFITGAWASEYGNALSGAFDLKLRKGNNQRHEYTLQAGVLGLNVAAEGPLKLGRQKGSFLVNYRYSTLELLSKLGIGVGSGVLDFQDLSYNIQLPTANAGSFTLFGFNGHSSQTAKAAADSSKWETEDDRYGYRFGGTTRFNGATHQIRLGRNSLLKSALGYSYVKSSYHESYINELLNTQVQVNDRNVQQKVTFTSTLNQRISNNQSLRTGVI
ncbi:MAG TPA: carboxypeptidase-like regulatory domain-containing protein, partial [Phnomibacter sp.]|nr:carboxypeptidase-like regulatory domain-containing protein [Phnomibacter sp.]